MPTRARGRAPIYERVRNVEAAVRQVTFDVVGRDSVPWMVRRSACALVTSSEVYQGPSLALDLGRPSSHFPGLFTLEISRQARLRAVCHAELLRSTLCFHSDKNKVCNVSTTSLSRWRDRPVTPAAQARNAKKNFAGLLADRARLCSCNVCRAGRLAGKFPENRVVSTAVTHSFNCIVYERHHLVTSPDRLRLFGVAARITAPRFLLTGHHPAAGGAR